LLDPESMMRALHDYAIDTVAGFIPKEPPLLCLPEAFAAWEGLVPAMSGLLRTRTVREAILALPELDPSTLVSSREHERAMLLLTVFANAWVWGAASPSLTIPRVIAVPLCAIASRLDRPPLVHYASMALNNWQLVDPKQSFSADNARMQVQFLGGVDEDWFFIASLGVELAGAPILSAIHQAVQVGGAVAAELALEKIASGMPIVLAALARMREWCEPQAFYLRVRPFLTGWPEPGVIYEGVSPEPRKFVGGSAGQSSLIQALDAFLGVDHPPMPAGAYLLDLRRYMPVAHRRFVVDVERSSQAREFAEQGPPALRQAYDEAVRQVSLFRQAHRALAHEYIVVPSGMSSKERGTGGTMLQEFLDAATSATERSRLR
jgi:indoleamine 2,3-dioxygenase